MLVHVTLVAGVTVTYVLLLALIAFWLLSMAKNGSQSRKNGGKICCMCSNTYKNTTEKKSMHVFPVKKPQVFKKWVSIVKSVRKHWQHPAEKGLDPKFYRETVVCCDHFERKCFKDNGRLISGSIPTIPYPHSRSTVVGRSTKTSRAAAQNVSCILLHPYN